VVLTGLSRMDNQGSIPMFPFVMQEKRLLGSVYGSGNPARDIPKLVSLYQHGRLKLNELVSRTYALDRVNDALTALASSDGARGAAARRAAMESAAAGRRVERRENGRHVRAAVHADAVSGGIAVRDAGRGDERRLFVSQRVDRRAGEREAAGDGVDPRRRVDA